MARPVPGMTPRLLQFWALMMVASPMACWARWLQAQAGGDAFAAVIQRRYK